LHEGTKGKQDSVDISNDENSTRFDDQGIEDSYADVPEGL
jgi:hypothetical protein